MPCSGGKWSKMEECICLRIDPKNINYLNRIMEGYEYLGVVTTIDRAEGILMIRVTPDTYEEVKKILANLPIFYDFV